MPLSTSFAKLELELISAYEAAAYAGEQQANNLAVRTALSSAIAMAITRYYTAGVITTDVTIKKGQLDSAGGRTSATRKGEGTGTVTFTGNTATLTTKIFEAFVKAEKKGEEQNSSDDVIDDLAASFSSAVRKYYESVKVTTAVTVLPGGGTIGCAAAPAKPTANIISPGPGTGQGKIVYTKANELILKGACKAAFAAARKAGAEGAGMPATVAILAGLLAAAFHAFAKTGKVETDVSLTGGQSVLGYMIFTPAGAPAPFPTPVITTPFSGNSGEGKIS